MTYLPNFKHDVFVSYAHFDNEEDAQDVRWVSRFQADLKNVLRQRLGEEPEIFFDSRNFEAHNHVDFLVENARQSAVFVAVFSPSYVAREFTIKELQAFCDGAPALSRLVMVELLPVEENKHHPLLRGRKRTPFWWKDRSEHDIPLRLTPKFNPEMYNERLQILAHQIKKVLAELRESGTRQPAAVEALRDAPRPQSQPQPQPAEPVAPAGNAVLLAQATDDLYDDYERVRAHLEQFGLKVLPEHDYPQGGTDFAAAFEADIARSRLFVQLLGNFGSRKPPDLPQTYSQYQYEAAKGRGLKVLQWRRPDLDLAAVTHRDKTLLEGPDVLAVGLEEFKGEILRFCAQEQAKLPAPSGGDCHVFINADRSDKDLADALLKLFEDKKNCTAARPLFEGSAKDIIDDLEANLVSCGVLLLLYGSAPPAWVRAQLLRYSKLEKQRDAPLRLKSVVLGPPAPKPELAFSGGFERIDCQDGNIVQNVQRILAGLQL
jgi:TIR domain